MERANRDLIASNFFPGSKLNKESLLIKAKQQAGLVFQRYWRKNDDASFDKQFLKFFWLTALIQQEKFKIELHKQLNHA